MMLQILGRWAATMSRVTALLMVALPGLGCGSGDASAPPSPGAPPVVASSSQVVMTTPPVTGIASRVLLSTVARGGDHSSLLVRVRGAPDFTLSFPGEHVLMACAKRVSGTDYLLVSTTNISSGVGSLFAYSDTDADDVIDVSSKVTVFTTGSEKAYFTSIAISPTRWFLLDSRCQDVWVADAPNGLPVSISSTRFARSADHVELLQVRHLQAQSADSVTGTPWSAFPRRSRSKPPELAMTDTTSDQVADAVTYSTAAPVPDIEGVLYAGQTQCSVLSQHADTIEVWRLDTAGSESVLLGSTVSSVAIGGAEWVQISLSPALALDERVRVRYALQTEGTTQTVSGAFPLLQSLDVDSVPSDVGGTVTVTGVNFTSTMDVVLVGGVASANPAQPLTFTLVSGTEISVTVPALGSAWEGRAYLFAMENAQEVYLNRLPLTVSAP